MNLMLFPPSWYGPAPDYYANEPVECPRCGFAAGELVDGLCSTCDDDLGDVA